MNCPTCGATMHLKPDEDSFRCDYCQSVYLPEKDADGVRVLGEPTEDACSVCDIPLVHASIAQTRILYCTRCRAMLIPMEALETLVDELRAQQGGVMVQSAADSGDLRRTVDCPHCHARMDAHLYAGPGNVVIDSCEPCLLVWLDHGKLARIVRAPDSHSPATYYDSTNLSADSGE